MALLFDELRERLLRAGVAPRHVRRYLRELSEHLADLRAEEERAGKSTSEAGAAALTRLGGVDALANAMIGKRQLQAWSARAPWAMFSAGPLACLAGAYLIACCILWTGWQMFLPGTKTPFVPVDGLAVFYFGVGRMIYWGAPVLVGWGIGVTAARQRLNATWPLVGLVLIALVGCTAQVHAIRAAMPGGTGRVSMSLTVGPSYEENLGRLTYALAIFAVTAMPYFAWRLKRARAA
ncbi:MAG TPA: hypothetical protein VMR02_03330 [Terracidiphilus sp.]|jgi:hypothetical protein|nr:hypothetical protein [Terracidiphilus sp.]